MTFDDALKNYGLRMEETLFAVYYSEAAGEDIATEITLWWSDGVGTTGSHHDHEEWRLGDCDLEGNCFMKVPATAIKYVLTGDETESFWAMQETDARLLSYAR